MALTVVVAQKKSVKESIIKALNDSTLHITCVSGHIYHLSYNTKYAWSKDTLVKVVTEDPVYLKSDCAKQSFKNLNYIINLKQPFELILATDPDNQGKLIGTHIWQYLSSKGCKILDVKQVKLQSLNKKDIQKEFRNLMPVSADQGLSAQLRARIDLLYGAFLSRLASVHAYQLSKKWTTYNTGRGTIPFVKVNL